VLFKEKAVAGLNGDPGGLADRAAKIVITVLLCGDSHRGEQKDYRGDIPHRIPQSGDAVLA
jgi:hypothetical protein